MNRPIELWLNTLQLTEPPSALYDYQLNQQNKNHVDNLGRAGQRAIEPQKFQKGAVLYSAVQLSVMPVTAL